MSDRAVSRAWLKEQQRREAARGWDVGPVWWFPAQWAAKVKADRVARIAASRAEFNARKQA